MRARVICVICHDRKVWSPHTHICSGANRIARFDVIFKIRPTRHAVTVAGWGKHACRCFAWSLNLNIHALEGALFDVGLARARAGA